MTEDKLLKPRTCDSLDFLVGRKLIKISVEGTISPMIEITLGGGERVELKLAKAKFEWINPESLPKLYESLFFPKIDEVRAWVNAPCPKYTGLLLHWCRIRTSADRSLWMHGRTFDPITTPFVVQMTTRKPRPMTPPTPIKEQATC